MRKIILYKLFQIILIIFFYQTTVCALCRSAVGVLIDFRRAGMSAEELAGIAVDLCVNLEIQPENVCKGAIDMNVVCFELRYLHICAYSHLFIKI